MIDPAACADRLIAAGLNEAERAATSELFQQVHERWRVQVGTGAPAAWWVPGRLEVFGTHTDYAGGRTLVAAVPRGFAVLAAARTDGRIRITDAGAATDETVTLAPRDSPGRFRGWRHYVAVAAARLAHNFPGSALGADIVFASNLPRAAGMSSSSALVVGVATALIQVAAIRDRREWQREVRSVVDEAGYLACIENGRTFGGLTGDAGVGTHGGSEDHAAMLAGTAGACSAFTFVPMRHLETIPVPDTWSVVVATSGIGAHKTGRERDAYNRLSEGTRLLLELWNAPDDGSERLVEADLMLPAESLAAVLAATPSALATLRLRVDHSAVAGWPVAALRDRLEHFVGEDARVAAATEALARGDAGALGRLAADSQRDAEQLLRNQVPETSALVRLGVAAGAMAARSFGAGFGGSVWALVQRPDVPRFVEQWMSAYRAERPDAAARATAFAADPGPPVTRVA